MRCEICNKPIKENTDGNKRYCQGHGVFEDRKMYQCSLCGGTDSKTFREAREGNLVTICESCERR